ncbi:hypothetical protein [Halopiger djelfimassiliensis]|uniref:hypothetical protein n=1 Tax=Halopiger djelfimassiliensis TaxID=1293047 RepID=UPI000B06A8DA|nr:hypothetical protein [Halopiger djelfimassiliensis]
MSLFERLGERVEEFKQEAEAARDDAATYRCRECEKRFYRDRDTCPECDGDVVEIES